MRLPNALRSNADRPTRLRMVYIDGRAVSRRPTLDRRMLPKLIIAGGQRCGTTSLFKYLEDHPAVHAPLEKEPQYFGWKYAKGEAWYRGLFPLAPADPTEPALTYEATPYYLFHPLAPQRASMLLPHARVIVLVRDPAERAYSHWQHSVRLGVEDLSFLDACAAEAERLVGEEDRIRADIRYPGLNHRVYSYQARGIYVPQIDRWREYFPDERILVLRSEDMFTDAAGVYDRVLAFLGLTPHQPAEFAVHTKKGTGPKPAPMDDDTRARLHDVFAADQETLARLLASATTLEATLGPQRRDA